jgi:adenylyltransferase/sulfurtransferase
LEASALLTEDERRYYSRQIVLPDFGESGQKKLKEARILIAGIGGLGTFSSMLLAEMGVGYLRIVDRDIIEKTNLHRTPLYTEEDLDYSKVEVAAIHLKRLNPKMTVETHACHINNENIKTLLDGEINLVIDGLDNFTTRRIINRECVKRGIPFIFCGVSGITGNVAAFNASQEAPCLSCLYHEVNDNDLESCDITGIHPALLAVMTGFQVHEAINLLLQQDTALNANLLFVDLKIMSFNQIPLHKNPQCPVCSSKKEKVDRSLTKEYYSLDLCGENSIMIVPERSIEFNFANVKESITSEYNVVKEGKLAVTIQYSDNITITFFQGGNALFRGLDSKDAVLTIWKDLQRKFLQ